MINWAFDQDYSEWGKCYSSGDYGEASKCLERVLRRAEDPLDIGFVHTSLARTYFQAGNLGKALQHFERADSATGGDAETRMSIANYLFEFCDRPDLALGWIKRILDRHDNIVGHENIEAIGQDNVIAAARESFLNLEAVIAEQQLKE